MSDRILWGLLIAVLCLLGISGIAPAFAWDGFNRFSTTGFPSGVNIHTRQARMPSSVVEPHRMARRTGNQDDFRSHQEMMRRYLRLLEREGNPIPDLFLIDGGKV